jgi:hypothetical protein
MCKRILLGAALLTGALSAHATIIPYSWQRFDQYKNPTADATGNGHVVDSGFTGNGESPFNSQPVVNNICVGGPLGPEGYFSAYSIRGKANQNNQGGIFDEPVPLTTNPQLSAGPWGNFFQTNSNWVVECWVLPTRNGANAVAPFLATGLSRNNRSPGRQNGIILTLLNGQDLAEANSATNRYNDGHVFMRCQAFARIDPVTGVGQTNAFGDPANFYIGPPVLVKTPTNSAWIHVAVVRDTVAGTVAWYTNGTMVAATNLSRVWWTNDYSSISYLNFQDAGLSDNSPLALDPVNHLAINNGACPMDGYMAELRWSYFNPGEFSVTNLLTRRASPGSSTVWTGPSIVI